MVRYRFQKKPHKPVVPNKPQPVKPLPKPIASNTHKVVEEESPDKPLETKLVDGKKVEVYKCRL